MTVTNLYYFADGRGPRRRPIAQARGAIPTGPNPLLSGLPVSAWWTTDRNATRARLGGTMLPTWVDHRYTALDSLEALRDRREVVQWVTVRDLFDSAHVAIIEQEYAEPLSWWLGLATIGVQRDRTYNRSSRTLEPAPTLTDDDYDELESLR